jgi:hypothetical protein
MTDRGPPDDVKVSSPAAFQQEDADELKDAIEQALRAYVERRAARINNTNRASSGQPP